MTEMSGNNDKENNHGSYYAPFKPLVRCTDSTLESSFSCMFTTNVRHECDFPEIVAVNVQPSAKHHVEQCLDYIAHCMVNSNMIVPDKYRFTLRLEGHVPDFAYFACLHVTSPAELQVLYQYYMDNASTITSSGSSSNNMVIMLMPIFHPAPNDDLGDEVLLWGRLPAAPQNKHRTRDHIKFLLEDQLASPCGWIRHLDKNLHNTKSSNLVRVSLCEVLLHMNGDDSWEIDWERAQLKKREVLYVKKNTQHFIDMCMDGTALEKKAKNYFAALCANASRWKELHQDEKLLGGEDN